MLKLTLPQNSLNKKNGKVFFKQTPIIEGQRQKWQNLAKFPFVQNFWMAIEFALMDNCWQGQNSYRGSSDQGQRNQISATDSLLLDPKWPQT